MHYQLGTMTPPIAGDISQLHAILFGDPSRIEVNLGFHAGRLAQGYKILLLKNLPLPSAFEFGGTTLRSGGRAGKPLQSEDADQDRTRVHDQIVQERGEDGYRALQETALSKMQVRGPNRLVKILPEIRHDANMSPADQYPMGGGFLQWTLLKPGVSFLYAASVSGDGEVTLPDEDSFSLHDKNYSEAYARRTRLQLYLQQA